VTNDPPSFRGAVHVNATYVPLVKAVSIVKAVGGSGTDAAII
jgi:hypothetical protein